MAARVQALPPTASSHPPSLASALCHRSIRTAYLDATDDSVTYYRDVVGMTPFSPRPAHRYHPMGLRLSPAALAAALARLAPTLPAAARTALAMQIALSQRPPATLAGGAAGSTGTASAAPLLEGDARAACRLMLDAVAVCSPRMHARLPPQPSPRAASAEAAVWLPSFKVQWDARLGHASTVRPFTLPAAGTGARPAAAAALPAEARLEVVGAAAWDGSWRACSGGLWAPSCACRDASCARCELAAAAPSVPDEIAFALQVAREALAGARRANAARLCALREAIRGEEAAATAATAQQQEAAQALRRFYQLQARRRMVREALERQLRLDQDAACDVCRDPAAAEGDDIVFCERCNVAVHQACYGVWHIPSGDWFCDACQRELRRHGGAAGGVAGGSRVVHSAGAASASAAAPVARVHTLPSVRCAVCGQRGGALKLATDGRWVHAFCVRWHRGLHFADERAVASVDGALLHHCAATGSVPCALCGASAGAVVRCTEAGCGKRFHLWCARQAGYVLAHESGARGRGSGSSGDHAGSFETGAMLRGTARCAHHLAAAQGDGVSHKRGAAGSRGAKGGLPPRARDLLLLALGVARRHSLAWAFEAVPAVPHYVRVVGRAVDLNSVEVRPPRELRARTPLPYLTSPRAAADRAAAEPPALGGGGGGRAAAHVC